MIGDWDNSNVVFALLPACLGIGENPAAYSKGAPAGIDPAFPVYNGPDGGGITSNMSQYYEYANGTLHGTPHAAGGILQINGSDPSGMAPSNTVTMEMWFDLYATTQWSYYFECWPDNTSYLYNFISSSSRIATWWKGDGGVGLRVVKENMLTAGRYQLVWKKDGQTVKYYINGNEIGDYRRQDSFTDTLLAGLRDYRFIIYHVVGEARPSTDLLAAILYNRPLGDEEISDNYNRGPTLGGLMGYGINGNEEMILESNAERTNYSNLGITM